MNLNQTQAPASLVDDIEVREFALPLAQDDADEIARQYLIDIDSFDMFEDCEETENSFNFWLDSGATLIVYKADARIEVAFPE